VRKLVALALLVAGCGSPDRRESPASAASSSSMSGPDAIVLRVPRGGGNVRAFAYPNLDSLVWSAGTRAPALGRVLSFDQEAGTLVYLDTAGAAGRIDFRLGLVGSATRARLASVSSTDGSAVFGVSGEGVITRLTPSGTWTVDPKAGVRQLLPQGDGALLVVLEREDGTVIQRRFPPDEQVTDSGRLTGLDSLPLVQAGDRVYASDGVRLVGVRARDLQQVPSVRLSARPSVIMPTPSGDRIFVALQSEPVLAVVDRYENDVVETIELPGIPSALRMDPLGRYLLARAPAGDSVWVVAIGSNSLVGTIRATWRGDLPLVAPDGAIVIARGDDVVLVDGASLRPRRVVAGGASDFWHTFQWNGFRPRAKGLDRPVEFRIAQAAQPTGDSLSPTGAADPRAAADSARGSRPGTITSEPRVEPAPATAPVFTVSFAALLNEDKARELAVTISVDGQRARVVSGMTSGTRVYRVVLGPYRSREEAERVGRESGVASWWVFEGTP
jgi:hypothetical protein